MNRKMYLYPMGKRMFVASGFPASAERIFIDDADRAKFLLDKGYLPKFIDKLKPEHSEVAMEWALKNGFCPAYWRPATKDGVSGITG